MDVVPSLVAQMGDPKQRIILAPAASSIGIGQVLEQADPVIDCIDQAMQCLRKYPADKNAPDQKRSRHSKIKALCPATEPSAGDVDRQREDDLEAPHR